MLVAASSARAQFFSPGPLAAPHASFEGLDNCSKCHAQQENLAPTRCLACHVELGGEIGKRVGLHGRMSAETRNQCQRCHPDHRGRDFPIVDWPGEKQKFQHARTGYLLEGKHARLACEACHARAKVTAPEILRMLAAEPTRTTYLGLSTRCDSCHFDEHRGQLGTKCQTCHVQSAWRPAPAFNHQGTAYPLRDKHKSVACANCHPALTDEEPPARAFPVPRGPSYMQMKPIDHASCSSCHDDPHETKLGPRCTSCHSEAGWHVIAPAGGLDRAFHKRTAFPLEGAHATVACRSCHGPFPGSPARYKGLPFARCGNCHEDAHVGQLVDQGEKNRADCSACHDVNGFAPPHFEREQHERTQFPLDGAHAATACRACHPLDPRLASLVPAPVRSKLRRERRPLLVSDAVLRPKRTPQKCSACHQDPHQGQFAAQLRDNDCAACHKTSSFADLKFDHDVDSRFPLTGAHRKVACASCHVSQPIRPKGPPTVRYAPIATACAGCHADQHQGQFTWVCPPSARTTTAASAGASPEGAERRQTADCAFCHQTTSFRETLFSHADRRFTTFALGGKHSQLACAACHHPVEVAPHVIAVRYRPVPRTCAACHVDFHHGAFRGFEP